MTQASVAVAEWRGKRVIDIGCGDGTYTAELLRAAGPRTIHGVDPARAAIGVARERTSDPRVSFAVGSAHELPHSEGEYDLAYLRGVLHHVDRPAAALAEALRVASLLVIVEPNGYNPGLKLLERVSRYHREHAERSFHPPRLDRWAAGAGGVVVARQFIGFVPMFSPDGYARKAKLVEPVLERLPLLRQVACAQYVFSVARRQLPSSETPAP